MRFGSHHQIFDNTQLPHNAMGCIADQILHEDWRTVSLRNYTEFFTKDTPGSSLVIYGELYGHHKDFGKIQNTGPQYAQGLRFAVFDVGVFRPNQPAQLMDWHTLDRFTAHLSFEIVLEGLLE